jgi:hypothetical protein
MTCEGMATSQMQGVGWWASPVLGPPTRCPGQSSLRGHFASASVGTSADLHGHARPSGNLATMPLLYEVSPPRVSCTLAPGRVGCERAPSLVCTRASSTRAAYDHAQTSDRRGGTMLRSTLRAGCVQAGSVELRRGSSHACSGHILRCIDPGAISVHRL